MLKHLYHFLIALCLPVLAASCADDLATMDGPDAAPGKGIVRLSVPGTRSIPTNNGNPEEANATEQERAVRDLWFLAYPTEDGQGEPVIRRLDTDKLEHEYQTFSIEMPFGTYQVYVVANVDELSYNTTKEELNKIILNYTEGEDLVLPDPAKGLPMFYKHAEDFTVNENGGTINADLEFCCVKVRYTLLFDNSDFSQAAFGNNYLLINSVNGRNIATQAKLVPDSLPIAEMKLKDNALSGQYVEGYNDTNAPEAAFSTLSKPQNDHNKWAYRGTFYLPEHYVSSNSEQSQIIIDASLYNTENEEKANVQYTIELGEVLDPNNEEGKEVRQLPRARYYDITGYITSLGDKIETTVAVQDWTPVKVETELESPYHLWVQETVIEKLVAGTAVTIPCRTDAPVLEAYSPTIEIKDENITLSKRDIYIVTFNDDYTAFTVQINPTIPPSTKWEEQYNHILIRIPDPETDEYLLSKRIDINSVSTKPYFHVNPPQYTIYVSEIGNEPTYDAVFTYETNMTDVEVKCGKSDVNTTGISWTGNQHITLTDSGLKDGKGTVTVTLDRPYEPSYYSITQTVVLDYTATDSRNQNIEAQTAKTRVTIIPNAQTYRLHFRPINDNWTNPHIYVYEPLYAPNGTPVKISGGGNLVYNGTVKDFYQEKNGNISYEGEDALMYSFTGKRTFNGWETFGGTVEVPTSYHENHLPTGTEYYWDGDYHFSLKYLQLDGTNSIGATSAYNWNIDYVDSKFRQRCSECNMNTPKGYNDPALASTIDGYNFKWPGVAMLVDANNPGWYYFDLPALAQPGTARIMFADGHDGPSGAEDHVRQHRYPAHMVPGVPLYDFADKDGWFLYDPDKGDENEFVDDKPEIVTTTYRINITGHNSFSRIHVWIENRTDIIITSWDDNSTGVIQTDEKGQRYFQFTLRGNLVTERFGYKFVNSSDSDKFISNWQPVTGKDYDYEYTIN